MVVTRSQKRRRDAAAMATAAAATFAATAATATAATTGTTCYIHRMASDVLVQVCDWLCLLDLFRCKRTSSRFHAASQRALHRARRLEIQTTTPGMAHHMLSMRAQHGPSASLTTAARGAASHVARQISDNESLIAAAQRSCPNIRTICADPVFLDSMQWQVSVLCCVVLCVCLCLCVVCV